MSSLTRTLRDRRGVAAIEFAVIAPVLGLLLVATIELGFMMRARIVVQEAVSAGALYASQHSFDAAGITAIMAATANATNEGAITAGTPTLSYGCPTVSGVTPATAGSVCADGIAARRYVTISASTPRVSIMGSDFGLPANATASSTVRLP